MRILGMALALLVAAAAYPAEATHEVTPERVAQLIKRLGSNQFRERAAATRALDSLGEAALDALKQAACSDDLETRQRATELIQAIEFRLATARILAATPVEFDYQNTPLPEAVADLAKRTGFPVVLHDPAALARRRVTAGTNGKVDFWQALALFCRKADLHEWDGIAPLPAGGNQPTAHPGVAQGQIIMQGNVRVFRRQVVNAPTPTVGAGGPVRLLDGPAADLPVYLAGAVRVRALPPGSPLPQVAPAPTDLIVPLLITPEPKLAWANVPALKITRALDEFGDPLAVLTLPPVPAGEEENVVVLGNGMIVNNGRQLQGPAGATAVRLRRGERVPKRLRELAGRVTAPVRVAETLMTVEQPLKAAGRAIQGPLGAVLKLDEVVTGENGSIKVRAELQLPPEIHPGARLADGNVPMPFPMPMGRRAMQQVVIAGNVGMIQNVSGNSPDGGADFLGVALFDAQGHKFAVELNNHTLTANNQGLVQQFTVTYHPTSAVAGEPVKLTFTGSRPTTVEVPFVLRDVPLP